MFIAKKQYNSTIQSYEDTIKALQNSVDGFIRANEILKKENEHLKKVMKSKTKVMCQQHANAISKRKKREEQLQKQIDSLKHKNEIYKGFIVDPEGFSKTCGKLLEKLEDTNLGI